MAYSITHIDDIEGAGPAGSVRFVRRVLGVEAFGINCFEIAPKAGPDGLTMIAVGARRGSYEPRGPF